MKRPRHRVVYAPARARRGRSAGHRGTIAVLAAMTLTVLLGVAACVVDLGMIRMWHQQIQLAVDAGALAATRELDGTVEGMIRARERAVQITGVNEVNGTPVIIDGNSSNAPDGDVVLGYWENRVFYPYSADPERVTAVRVAASRSDLRTFFASAAFAADEPRDLRHVGVGAASTALGGGPTMTNCPIPIGLPDCALDTAANMCDFQTRMNPDKGDNAGWARPGGQRPSGSYVENAIYGLCEAPSSIADGVTLNNGVMTSATKDMSDAVNASMQEWDEAVWGPLPERSSCSTITPNHYGKVIVGVLPIFHDPSYCTNTQYNGQDLTVKGYATAVIYDVCSSGSVDNHAIFGRVVCNTTADAIGGGAFYGTVVPPRTVD